MPTISDRDFVIATVAAPTIVKEPEKPSETTEEGSEGEAAATSEGTTDEKDKAKHLTVIKKMEIKKRNKSLQQKK